jgi:hypothetical protein
VHEASGLQHRRGIFQTRSFLLIPYHADRAQEHRSPRTAPATLIGIDKLLS